MAVEQDQMDKVIIIAYLFFFAGCATTSPSSVKQPDSFSTQMEAAKKIVGAMSPDKGSVEKYSPVSGKHYSGALEYEPGTGVKLLPVEE